MKRNRIYHYFIILLVAGFSTIIKGCTESHYTYGIAGTQTISADGLYVCLLVAETNGTTSQENGGYRSTDYKSSYWLKLYETATGKLVRKKQIVSAAENKNMQVHCYGGFGDKIWLYTNGITAYNFSKLEEVVNEAKLAEQNRFDVNNFPDDPRFIDDMITDGYIRFTSPNTAQYIIDVKTLKVTGAKELPGIAVEKINEKIRSQMAHHISYGLRIDTSDSNIYILAKDSVSAMNIYPGNSDNEPVNKRLYLFSGNFTIRQLGNHKFYDYMNMKMLPGASYLNGIFLKDLGENRVFQLTKPGGYLILHNDSLTNEAGSIVTAIDKNNNMLWQINTGLSTRITNCSVKNKYCILTGNRHYLLGPHIGSDMICVIDLESGKQTTPSIAE